jgi:hypothetical protein
MVPISKFGGGNILSFNGKTVWAKASASRKTKNEAGLMIEFDDGSTVTCTKDHPFLIGENFYRADSLQVGDCVRSVDMIQLEHGRNHIRQDTSIYGEEILPMQVLLPEQWGAIAQGYLALHTSRNRDTEGLSYSPQGRKCTQQRAGESGNDGNAPSSNRPCYDTRAISEQKAEHDRKHNSQSGTLAQISSCSRVSSLARKEKLGKQDHKSLNLRTMWERICNKASRFIQILSSKLQGESPASTKTVISIKRARKQQFYNLDVEGTNNFVLSNGVIVHNSYDSVRYGLMALRRPAQRLRRAREADPWADEPLFLKKIRGVKKKKVVNSLTGW